MNDGWDDELEDLDDPEPFAEGWGDDGLDEIDAPPTAAVHALDDRIQRVKDDLGEPATDAWGDNLDLDVDVATPAPQVPTVTAIPAKALKPVTTTISPEGWGDDNDLGLDDIGEPNPPSGCWKDDSLDFGHDQEPVHPRPPPPPKRPAGPPPPPARSSIRASVTTSGWGEDDDLNFDDDEPAAVVSAASVQPSAAPNGWGEDDLDLDALVQGTARVEPPIVANGWGEDDDLDLDDDENDQANKSSTRQDSEGWDDFDEFDGDDEQVDETPIAAAPVDPRVAQLYQDLQSYHQSLQYLGKSVNAVLEAECNTPDKALELIHYYMERPQLVAYTVEKELPRMEYSMREGNRVVTDKKEIARRLMHGPHSLLGRCANQSLLADLLQVFTGDDLLVRPRFLATAIADACRFRLDFEQDLVQTQAQLSLSLPTTNGRWKMAELIVSIVFVPDMNQPFVEYRLDQIDMVSLDPSSLERELRSAAQMLTYLHPEESEYLEMTTGHDTFRDAFLQRSQNLLQNSAQGMHSAWKEFESATGLRNKFGNLLPNREAMQAAEEAPSSPRQRPTSILGGFMRSGLTRLAKTVALPDEDPSVYQEWQGPAKAVSENRPELYRKPAPPPPPMPSIQEPPRPGAPPPPPRSSEPFPGRPKSPPRPPTAPTRPPPPRPPPDGFPKLYREQEIASPSQTSPQSIPDAPLDLSPGVSSARPGPIKSPAAEHWPDDGWGDDQDLGLADEEDWGDTLDDQGAVEASSIKERPRLLLEEYTIAPDDFVYNPETGIIPTRRRWVNPRPGPRRL